MRLLVHVTAALLFVALQPLQARETPAHPSNIPANGIIGVDDAMLDPAFWVRRLPDADRVVLDRDAIAAQNERLRRQDRSIHDALKGLTVFSETYQASVDQPLPLFRRR